MLFENVFVRKERNFFAFQNKNLNEYFEILLYTTILFALPLFHTNQLIVGTIVNALLIKSALNHSMKRMFFLAFIPSLGVIATGFLFAELTQFVLLMVPFIWVSNLLLIFGVKKLFVENKKNYFVSGIIASIGKVILLSVSVFVLYIFSFVPLELIAIFGFNQLITSVSGVMLVGISKIQRNKKQSCVN